MNQGFVLAGTAVDHPVGSIESPFLYGYDPLTNGSSILVLDQHQPSAAEKDRPNTRTILLVEDNDDLRTVLAMYLDSMGYDVVPCCDGHVASAVFRSGVSIDALVTDLEMPGKSGLDLARELTSLRPSLPVLIVSGAFLTGDMEHEIRNRQWRFIAKPCRLPSILSTLQDLLCPSEERAA